MSILRLYKNIADTLNLVFAQGMNEISESNILFSTLNVIATFSYHSSKRSFAVKEYLKIVFHFLSKTRWSFTSRLGNSVELYLKPIVDFFLSISETYDDNWNGSHRCNTRGYVNFLSKFKTVFLLNLFTPLFSQTDVLGRILQK